MDNTGSAVCDYCLQNMKSVVFNVGLGNVLCSIEITINEKLFKHGHGQEKINKNHQESQTLTQTLRLPGAKKIIEINWMQTFNSSFDLRLKFSFRCLRCLHKRTDGTNGK